MGQSSSFCMVQYKPGLGTHTEQPGNKMFHQNLSGLCPLQPGKLWCANNQEKQIPTHKNTPRTTDISHNKHNSQMSSVICGWSWCWFIPPLEAQPRLSPAELLISKPLELCLCLCEHPQPQSTAGPAADTPTPFCSQVRALLISRNVVYALKGLFSSLTKYFKRLFWPVWSSHPLQAVFIDVQGTHSVCVNYIREMENFSNCSRLGGEK